MKEPIRFLSIAAFNVMLANSAVYAHNIPALINGETQLKAGHNKEAIREFTKAIQHNPKLAPDDLSKAYFNRGVAENAIGKTDAAQSDFKKAIEVDPTPLDAQAYKNRGLAKSALGDTDGARSDFKMAVSLGDNSTQELLENNG
ncbi:MAG: tetratricopeptide repeat protein [Chlorobiales bacterium]|nr:tetratricopeptide repeat protein [Chlorobiales bacterium]